MMEGSEAWPPTSAEAQQDLQAGTSRHTSPSWGPRKRVQSPGTVRKHEAKTSYIHEARGPHRRSTSCTFCLSIKIHMGALQMDRSPGTLWGGRALPVSATAAEETEAAFCELRSEDGCPRPFGLWLGRSAPAYSLVCRDPLPSVVLPPRPLNCHCSIEEKGCINCLNQLQSPLGTVMARDLGTKCSKVLLPAV